MLGGMPIYEYQASGEQRCAVCAEGFECLQKLADEPVGHCPECGAPVTRRISAPNVARKGSPDLSTSNIEKHGFTQYRKVGKGQYEKTAGKGPRTLNADD